MGWINQQASVVKVTSIVPPTAPPAVNAPVITSGGSVIVSESALPTGASTASAQASPPIPGLSIPSHDYISLSYTGANLTGVVYKTGGSGGTTVATLTLSYTGSVLDSVTKS